jgi:hypothetical protein
VYKNNHTKIKIVKDNNIIQHLLKKVSLERIIHFNKKKTPGGKPLSSKKIKKNSKNLGYFLLFFTALKRSQNTTMRIKLTKTYLKKMPRFIREAATIQLESLEVIAHTKDFILVLIKNLKKFIKGILNTHSQ